MAAPRPIRAIRKGDFKLIEYLDDMRVELYNLRDDISEAHDLAATMPDKVEELRERSACLAGGSGGADADPQPELRSHEAGTHAAASEEERSTAT